MKVFAVKPEVLAARKAEIVNTLSNAIGADVVLPVQDRTIVADLTMSGVQKIFETIDMHMQQCATVFGDNPNIMEAILLLTLQEAMFAMEGVLHQRAHAHMDGLMVGIEKLQDADIQKLIDEARAAGIPLPSLEELKAKGEELKKAFGL